MYPSPEQEAGNNAPSAYSYAGASPYSAQQQGESVPSASNDEQSSARNTSAQADPVAYSSPTIERRGLIVDLVAYPGRSVRSLCLPGLHTFASESLNARWDVVGISIFALPLLSSLIAFLLGTASHRIASGMLVGILLGPLIVIPILFFIVQGMIWPLARHYQGGGTFLEQCYTTFLPLAPLFLLGSIMSILLAIDSTSRIGIVLVLVEFLLFIYSSVLLVVSLKAVHGVTTWEAFTLAILPIFSILAVIVIVLIVAVMIAGSSNSDSSSSGSSSSNNNRSNKKNSGQNKNTNDDTNTYRTQNSYYSNNYWWGGSRYVNRGTDANPRLKVQWLCPACQYHCWMRQGPVEVACIRCGEAMQVTNATR